MRAKVATRTPQAILRKAPDRISRAIFRASHLTLRRIDSSRKPAELGLNLPEAVAFVVGVHVDQSFFHGGRRAACLDGDDALARIADRVLVMGRQWRYARDATLRAGALC